MKWLMAVFVALACSVSLAQDSIPERGGPTDWQLQLERNRQRDRPARCAPRVIYVDRVFYVSQPSQPVMLYGYYSNVITGRVEHGYYYLAR
jgi:hypothetical protein